MYTKKPVEASQCECKHLNHNMELDTVASEL